MNRDQIEGNWLQSKGNAKQQGSRLADDHLDVIAVKGGSLAGMIQEVYGATNEDAGRRLAAWQKQQKAANGIITEHLKDQAELRKNRDLYAVVLAIGLVLSTGAMAEKISEKYPQVQDKTITGGYKVAAENCDALADNADDIGYPLVLCHHPAATLLRTNIPPPLRHGATQGSPMPIPLIRSP